MPGTLRQDGNPPMCVLEEMPSPYDYYEINLPCSDDIISQVWLNTTDMGKRAESADAAEIIFPPKAQVCLQECIS